jgi:two-component system, cell cycle response regulator DivK
MKMNNARVPDVGRPNSPSRFVASEVMVAALAGTEPQIGGDPSSFLRKVCQRMRPLPSKRQRRIAERRKPSVLLVEDDPCNRELIEDIFRYDGIPAELVTASTAEESLIAAKNLMPMLILMDLKLPGMDGIEATRRLKRNSATEHIPVWAVTCLSQREDIERGLDAGCDGYVLKPLRRSEFVFRLLSLWDEPIGHHEIGLEPDDLPGADYWIS